MDGGIDALAEFVEGEMWGSGELHHSEGILTQKSAFESGKRDYGDACLWI
jgi:hypothetical protein